MSHESESAPRAEITPEQWNTIVWLTAEHSWWRGELDRRLDDARDSDPVWRLEP